jgi:dihydrofolate reductase
VSHGELAIIAAVARNGVVGVAGGLPWHLPDDLRRFKTLTMGHTLVMGRRTWESIGRPLPGRRSLVVSRTPGYEAVGALVFGTLDDALAHASGDARPFVIGGAALWREAMPRASHFFLTEVDAAPEGDVHFPPWSESEWREVERETMPGAVFRALVRRAPSVARPP